MSFRLTRVFASLRPLWLAGVAGASLLACSDPAATSTTPSTLNGDDASDTTGSGTPAAGTGSTGATPSSSPGAPVAAPSGSAAASSAGTVPTGGGAPTSPSSTVGAPSGGGAPPSTSIEPTSMPTAVGGGGGASAQPMDSAPSNTGGTGDSGGAGSLGGAASGGGGLGGGAVMPMEGEVLFTEDFEGHPVGERPMGWDDFVGWTKNMNNPAGENYAIVGTEQVHGGTQAVHFSGGANPAQITRPLPAGTDKIYVSAWVWMTRQLGENPGANHETLIAIRGESGSANDEIRFGEIKGVIGTNEVPSDNITPTMDQWGLGPAVPANTWACFEVAFIGDQPQHELHAWVDGELVHSATSPDQWQNGPMPETWMDGKFLEVVFGWHSFSSQEIEVWMDDIVVATGRRGCP